MLGGGGGGGGCLFVFWRRVRTLLFFFFFFAHPLQVSPVAKVTFAFPSEAFSRDSRAERESGEAAWMISSLQQLHTAARQSRNFLSNFQVAFWRKTRGHFRSEFGVSAFYCQDWGKSSAWIVSRYNSTLLRGETKGGKTVLCHIQKEERWVGNVALVMCGSFAAQGARTLTSVGCVSGTKHILMLCRSRVRSRCQSAL